MTKKRVAVLFGGRADEHSISCISAASVLRAIDRELFEPIPIGITKQGEWIVNQVDPRDWVLGQGPLPTVELTADSRRVVLDPARGGDGFFVTTEPVGAERSGQGEPAQAWDWFGSLPEGGNAAEGDSAEAAAGADGQDGVEADQEDGHSQSWDWFGDTTLPGLADRATARPISSLGHIDLVFPVLHGPYGEDGTVQGLLEMMGVPYVGCGVFASAVCMDKHFTKILLTAAGVQVAPGITVDTRAFDQATQFAANQADLSAQLVAAGLSYPLFVKPSRAGSSFGVSKVERAEELAAAIYQAAQHDWRVLVEQSISGREVECAVLATGAGTAAGRVRTSWPGEVVLDLHAANAGAFYDFDSKYTDAQASHVEVPARLPEETLQRVREVAAQAFTAVDGQGLARVDTFVLEDGSVVVNEINTMPGFTSISMYPKAWEASGLPYEKLISELIAGAGQ